MAPPCQKGVIFGRIFPAILPVFEKSSQNIWDLKSEYEERSGQWPNVQKHNNIRCRGWLRPMIWDITVRTVDARTDITYVWLTFPPVYPVNFQISRYSKVAGRFVRIYGLQIGENRPNIVLIWLLTSWHKFRIVARSSQFALLRSLPERLFFLPGVQMPTSNADQTRVIKFNIDSTGWLGVGVLYGCVELF